MQKFKKFFAALAALVFFAANVPTAYAAEEKVLNLAIMSEPPSIDPNKGNDTTSGAVITNVFETLTTVDDDNNIIPAAAESWEVSEDGLTYTFKLREDAKWSNGEPVTAEDFEYSWKRLLTPETAAPTADMLYVVEGAEVYHKGEGSVDDVAISATDDYTLEVKLATPAAYFLELIRHYIFAPVPKAIVENNPNWAAELTEDYVTNGAFCLEEWNHNSDLVLVPNEHYWDRDAVKLDRVNIQVIESEATATIQFISGGLDFIGAPLGSIALDNISTLEESGELQRQPQSAIYYYTLNLEDEVMANKNLRKALAFSIDRQELTKNVTQGNNTPLTRIVPSTIKGFEEPLDLVVDADYETAKEYLDKALEELGLSDPSELTLKLSYNTSEAHASIAQFVQSEWNTNLGINTELDNSEWQVYLDRVAQKDYQVGRLGWTGKYNDANTFLSMYRTADAANNYTGWENEDYKNLLDEASAEVDADKRIELLKEAEKIIVDELPVIPIYTYDCVFASKDYVKNMKPDALGRYSLKHVDIEQ